jgi:hypothetical protein
VLLDLTKQLNDMLRVKRALPEGLCVHSSVHAYSSAAQP